MISALIFDCFGVLYRDNIDMLYDAVPKESCQQLRDIIHASDHGYLSKQEYLDKVAEISGKTVQEIEQISLKQYSRNEELIVRVRELKNDYKIGLLSNVGEETMDRLFPQPERDELFDAFVISSKVGFIKPSMQIFELAAKQLDAPLDECVMIDDIPANVEGARAAGMQGILFTTNRQFENELRQTLEPKSA